MHVGGTVSFVVTLDGRWVGWVGDGRRFTGHGLGGRKWWACWKETGDTAARWNSKLLATRKAAVAELLAAVAGDTA